MKNVNIKDLARELNLSVSTISKAFHDSYEISEETKIVSDKDVELLTREAGELTAIFTKGGQTARRNSKSKF